MVKDIFPGDTGSDIAEIVVSGDRLFFAANDGTHGVELWSSDGSEQGTLYVSDINPVGSSEPNWLTDVDGVLYFSAFEPASGRELWRSNGTAEGTYLVHDLAPGTDSSNPHRLVDTQSSLYFAARNNSSDYELWCMGCSTMPFTIFMPVVVSQQ
jgi:ELWxxDGT repeat protein